MKRKSSLILIVCACFVSMAWGQQTTCGVSTPWAQFHRYNMQRSNPCEKVLNVKNVKNLSLKWSYATGAPSVRFIARHGKWGGVCGLVGQQQRQRVRAEGQHRRPAVELRPRRQLCIPRRPWRMGWFIPTRGYDVYALKASTGALLWSYATGNGVYSSPAVANGVVYIGSDDGNVYALNAKHRRPAVELRHRQLLCFPRLPWRMGWFMSARMTNNVYALNASTGALLWSYATGSGVNSSPAVANGVVYIGS